MKNKLFLYFIFFELLIAKSTFAQYARIELWSDSSKLRTTDEINLVKDVQIFDIASKEGDVFSEEYFNELHNGRFVRFTFFNMRIDRKLLSHIKNIRSDYFIFNKCIFEDSTIKFDNLYILYLELNSCNINRISKSVRRIKQLRALTITGSNIDILPKWIFKLKKLNLLNLTGNPISNLDVVLRKNSQLKYLILENCELEYKDVKRITDMLTGLVSLQIRSNNFDCEEFKKKHDMSRFEFNVCDQ